MNKTQKSDISDVCINKPNSDEKSANATLMMSRKLYKYGSL